MTCTGTTPVCPGPWPCPHHQPESFHHNGPATVATIVPWAAKACLPGCRAVTRIEATVTTTLITHDPRCPAAEGLRALQLENVQLATLQFTYQVTAVDTDEPSDPPVVQEWP